MGAFDRIKSGLPGMDRLLDSIRMGDNVVWSVSNLEEFTFFALPFAEQYGTAGISFICVSRNMSLCCYPEDAAQSGDITPSQAG